MANTKRGIDRWSSLEGTILNVTQPKNSEIHLMELSAKSSISNGKSHNNV
jgi:hypothetical protein